MDEIRVFVAATPAEWLPARVLEYSISEHTDCPINVKFLYESGIEIPIPDDIKNRPRTPFSFQRFLIPELCSYEGRAIYLDADMQVFDDISLLWNQPFNECDLQTVMEDGSRRGQFSVMVMNCDKLTWNIQDIVSCLNSGQLNYSSLMYEMKVAKNIGRDIKTDWNSLESYSFGATKLLHYTDMHKQPWVSLSNPLSELWVGCLQRAISAGFISIDELKREVLKGHVRPSLLEQLSKGGAVNDLKYLDRGFVAPYKKLYTSKKLSAHYIKGKLIKLFSFVFHQRR